MQQQQQIWQTLFNVELTSNVNRNTSLSTIDVTAYFSRSFRFYVSGSVMNNTADTSVLDASLYLTSPDKRVLSAFLDNLFRQDTNNRVWRCRAQVGRKQHMSHSVQHLMIDVDATLFDRYKSRDGIVHGELSVLDLLRTPIGHGVFNEVGITNIPMLHGLDLDSVTNEVYVAQ